MTKRPLFSIAFTLSLLVGIDGCNSPKSTPAAATSQPAQETHAEHDFDPGHTEHTDSGHDHAAHEGEGHEEDAGIKQTDMEKMIETLASLPAEDRASAMKQEFCPVGGETLGTMGAPKKIDVNGQAVWICCDGCKDKLLADPEKYLAKIAK